MTYDEKAELQRSLGRMEGKVDLLLLHFENTAERVENHEGRVSALEQDLAVAKSYAYAGSAAISLAVPVALKFFGFS